MRQSHSRPWARSQPYTPTPDSDPWTTKPAAQLLFSLDFSQGKMGPDFYETVIVSREL